jgi:predicted outer membrane protein
MNHRMLLEVNHSISAMRIFYPILALVFILPTSCNHGAVEVKDNKTLQNSKVEWAVRGGHAIDTASLLFAVTVCPNIMFEKAICELAETKASHANIRLFAEQLILDGDTTNDAYFQAIIKKGFLMTEELEPEQQKELAALTKAAKNFDYTFLTTLIKHLQRSVTFYEGSLPKLDYVELRRYAVTELASKHDHLKQAQRLLQINK